MKNFIIKLQGLHLFLVEKNGELSLNMDKEKFNKDPYDFNEDPEGIIPFMKNNKLELIAYLKEKHKKPEAIYKLSPLQEGLLFHKLYDEDSSAYVDQLVVDLPSELNLNAFESSWNYVIQNHTILRSCFLYEEFSIPVQCVYKDVTMPFTVEDYSSFSPTKQDKKLATFLEDDLKKGFVFTEAPLLRVAIIKISDSSYKMVFTSHHIILDGWSLSILLEEFLETYECLVKGNSVPHRKEEQYEDYIKYIAERNIFDEEKFWKTYLNELTSPCLLPFSKSISSNKEIGKAKENVLIIDADFTERLTKYAKQNHLTINTLVQGAWALLLSKYTGDLDVVFGVTVSGRPAELENSEDRIGLYINTLPLYAKLEEGALVLDWLKSLQLGHMKSREHQYTNLADIQRFSGIQGDLFNSILVFENYPISEALKEEDSILDIGNIMVQEQTNYPLTIDVNLGGKELNIQFSYNVALFDASTIMMIQNHFNTVLHQIIENQDKKISEVSILTTEEEDLLLGRVANSEGVNFNPKEQDLGNTLPINVHFEKIVEKHSTSIAVIDKEVTWNYEELNSYANQIAHQLLTIGVKEEKSVGVYLDRSGEFISCMLGILKSGGVYTPLDTQNPSSRIEKMLSENEFSVLITSSALLSGLTKVSLSNVIVIDELPTHLLDSIEVQGINVYDSLAIEKQAIVNPLNVNRMDSWAYVLYTSGSTGAPKGAITRHDGAMNHLLAEYKLLELADGFRFLQSAGIGSDISVWQILGPLLKGGASVIVDKYELLDYESLLETITRTKVSLVEFVPTYMWGLLSYIKESKRAIALTTLKWIMLVGEAIPVGLVNDLRSIYPEIRLLNAYGPCEASDDVIQFEITEDFPESQSRVPIGRVIPNMNVAILDDNLQLCPIGVTGELCVSGVGVGAGYLGLPERTSQSFIPNPYPDLLGDVLYKTGDLGRWLPDGNIEFLGREDHQVKIRGHRVELEGIASVLRKPESIEDIHVLVYKDEADKELLLCFVVLSTIGLNHDEGSITELLHELSKSELPTYMHPSQYCIVEEFPQNLSDKVDAKKLLSIYESEFSGERSIQINNYVSPRNELEEHLVNIWQELLGVSQVGVYDNFFELGGHSLLATRLVSTIRRELELEIAIKDVFVYSTINDLGIHLSKKSEGVLLPVIVSHRKEGRTQLSFSQERLWFLDQLQGSIEYHMPVVLKLKGKIDASILEMTLKTIIERHEVLRTVIKSENGIGFQEVISSENWHLPESNLEKESVEKTISNFMESPFDLENDYMLRAKIYHLEDDQCLLAMVFHHIASDGWSEGILITEFEEIYNSLKLNKNTELQSLELQYADYAVWQREYIEGVVLDKQLTYWEEKLKGITSLSLPTDYPRPSIQSTEGYSVDFKLDKEVSKAVKELCKEEGVTLFMVLLAAFKVLLSKYSGQEDVCVGTPIANRTQSELEGMIGFFVNTLALRTDLSNNPSFKEVLKAVKSTTLEGYDNQLASFEKVVDRVVDTRDMSMSPLFQVLFILQNTPQDSEIKLEELSVSDYEYKEVTSQFDITLNVEEQASDIILSMGYCTALFKEETIKSMLVHYQELLRSIITNKNQSINKLSILTTAEENELKINFNNTSVDSPKEKTLVDLFRENVGRTPNKEAIIFEGVSLTYKQLDEESNRLANYILSKHKVALEDLIVVKLERSNDLIISFLAVLKTGAAYLPIDPNYPQERISYIEKDSKSTIVIDKEFLDLFKEEKANYLSSAPEIEITKKSLAYVIYTSGSTGNPKGVMIEHKGIVNTVYTQIDALNINEKTHCLQFASSSFDASIWEIFLPLLSGAKLFIIEEDKKSDLDYFANYLSENNITIATLPPAFVKLMPIDSLRSLEVLITAGEQAPIDEALEFVNKGGKYINAYGPTETSICATTFQDDFTDKIPIGKPIGNTSAYILSDTQQLLPKGVVGELCIGGAGLARGYIDREELTEEKFIANPFVKGERIYRTGDLAKWLPDGNIEFFGRTDDQVKVRGYRIELGEIEAVLSMHSVIKNNCVLAVSDTEGTKRLVGYIVKEGLVENEEIETYLKTKLPEYMVPTTWVSLEKMPLTSNGKIDKKSLEKIELSGISQQEYVAPRNKIEVKLVKIWEELLEIDKIGIHNNFFELGGHSLLATRLVSMIRSELKLEVKIKAIFEHTTIANLSIHLAESSKTLLPALVVQEKTNDIPLSFSQERLWFLDQLQGSAEYHIPIVLRLKGKLSIENIEKSLKTVIERHEVLRAVIYAKEGVGYQQFLESEKWNLITHLLDEKNEEEVITSFLEEPFNLSEDFMLRACLYNLGDNNYVLACVIHHIASDGWSQGVLVSEFMSTYKILQIKEEPVLPKLKIQYSDYALWERKYIEGEILDTQLSYWGNKLKDITPLILPTDYIRPSIQSKEGTAIQYQLDKDLTKALVDFSKKEDVTLFMTLLAGFKVLLSRYSGQEDICIGTTIANRTQSDVEDMIGFFANTLALRTDLKGALTFTEILSRVKETTLEGYEHQQTPFEKVVDRVVDDRDMSMSPIFQVLFTLQNTPEEKEEIELEGITFSPYEYEANTSQFDLNLTIEENELGLSLDMEYCTDLFKEETINRFLLHYQELLKNIITGADQEVNKLSFLTKEEEHQLLHIFNDTHVNYPLDKTFVELFEEQVQKAPNSIAVSFGEKKITYKELDQETNQLGYYLESIGVKENDLVGICLDRSENMLIGILGILKAKGAYVPMKPDFPEARIEHIFEDAQCNVILVDEKGKDAVGELSNKINMVMLSESDKIYQSQPQVPLKVKSKPSSLGYVIYTSGSTGKPKGAMITQQGMLNHLLLMIDELEMDATSVVAFTAPFTFDISVWQMLSGLLCGGKIEVYSERQISDPFILQESLYNENVSILQLVPSYVSELLNANSEKKLEKLKYFLVTGEAVQYSLLSKWFEYYPSVAVVNAYGPAEAADDVSLHIMRELPSEGIVSIGKPVANMQLYIVDTSSNLCALGVVGEIWVGGIGVGQGYINDKERTVKSFIENPFIKSESKVYKTGDLGRWLPDGTIEFLGRQDDQIKIRGYRIELGEIENILSQEPTVNSCCVIAKPDSLGNNRLVSYVVTEGNFDRLSIQNYLKTKLPDYMVPQVWVNLNEMPLTKNGKIDKKELPEPIVSSASAIDDEGPRNEIEEKLIVIWQELLEVEKVGINDSFFELGGHSILAIQMVVRMNDVLPREITIAHIFEYPSIASLREYYATDVEFKKDVLVALQKEGTMKPIFCAPPAGGDSMGYSKLSKQLGNEQPLYGFQCPGLDGKTPYIETVEELATLFINEMQSVDSEGPYRLAGYSFGGDIIYEMMQQLYRNGFEVEELFVFEAVAPDFIEEDELDDKAFNQVAHFLVEEINGLFDTNIEVDSKMLRGKTKEEQLEIVFDLAKESPNLEAIEEQMRGRVNVFIANNLSNYIPKDIEKRDVPVYVFKTIEEGIEGELGWQKFMDREVTVFSVPGDHGTMLEEPHVQSIATHMKQLSVKEFVTA
ncbi:AMP-binding enzyme C-terminal domain-containing protein [Tenacibaculum sp. MAR_2010_89]|uniref:amino acid adenylation domain-containing protein n=1 Tax=Tenacibaculum sp. MAR_2010_89 TaxID=1250198 RepID=UPI00089D1E4D|nr:non-ribosomal peptide synthetase [Tenacibaculum sp. MAR_2010_89]SEE15321.1 AMP-binding enzyme C-terminal domain-containing protein [Tenacibaculum sp. MAR_2010_89]